MHDSTVYDVGSGPFSSLGHKTEKVHLDFHAVDPLGYGYNKMKERYGLNNDVFVETGFVELLDRIYGSNTFDMVSIENALDHCFDPLYGIYQLLNICKIGGMVRLAHSENEAENQKHSGLHQWNLSLRNNENSFVIWRDELRVNVCEVLADYVEFELMPTKDEVGYNVVIMNKKKDIVLPDLKYYESIFGNVYEYLLEVLLSDVLKE